MSEKIILVHPSEGEESIFQLIFEQMGIELLILEQKDYDNPIGAFLGLELPETEESQLAKKKAPTTLKNIDESIFIFVGFTRDRLKAFINIMKEIEAPIVDLKAMLTKVNQYWSPKQLYTEIAMERDYFREHQKPKPDED